MPSPIMTSDPMPKKHLAACSVGRASATSANEDRLGKLALRTCRGSKFSRSFDEGVKEQFDACWLAVRMGAMAVPAVVVRCLIFDDSLHDQAVEDSAYAGN
jgi:hypothetical protein